MADTVSKSWFCVFNNPVEHGFSGEPQEIIEQIRDTWIRDNPQRTCAVIYCISAEGLHHCHAVFEDTKSLRFSAIKKLFPSMHIEPTKGTKEQAEDYINKRGKWEEKGEIIIATCRHGEIKGAQGQRRDLDIIEELIQQGLTPDEIMDTSFSFRRYDRMIRDGYYRKRLKETPEFREVTNYCHVGFAGSGKSHSYLEMCEKYGSDSIYFVTDYSHPFDKYNGEPILFLDEFRGQLPYHLLLSCLDGYKVQIPCRYSNTFALWTEVHIASVFPPEMFYRNMVTELQDIDTLAQLMRRLNFIVYHHKSLEGEYKQFICPVEEYTSYEDLRLRAEGYVEIAEPAEQIELPF